MPYNMATTGVGVGVGACADPTDAGEALTQRLL